MNCSVTGVSGFVGSNLINRLSEKYTVFGFGRGELDFKDSEIVFHLACDGDSRGSNKKLAEHTRDNIDIFVKTLNEAIECGVKRFIYVSSAEAEKELNVYAIEKRTCEKLLQVMAKEYGFEYVIVRPYTLFGESMNLGDKNRNVIANFIKKTIAGEDVEIIGDINATRQFTYIGQLVDVLEKSIKENTNQTISVSSGIETSIKDLDYMIKNLYKTIKWVEKQ